MKTLLTFLICFVVIECSGQTKIKESIISSRVFDVDMARTIGSLDTLLTINKGYELTIQPYTTQKNVWCYNYSGDTLLLTDVTTFKFIKIGDRLFKIESPKLTEVNKEHLYRSYYRDSDGNIYADSTFLNH